MEAIISFDTVFDALLYVRDVVDAHTVPIEKDVGWGAAILTFGGTPHLEEIAGYFKDTLRASDQRSPPST